MQPDNVTNRMDFLPIPPRAGTGFAELCKFSGPAYIRDSTVIRTVGDRTRPSFYLDGYRNGRQGNTLCPELCVTDVLYDSVLSDDLVDEPDNGLDLAGAHFLVVLSACGLALTYFLHEFVSGHGFLSSSFFVVS